MNKHRIAFICAIILCAIVGFMIGFKLAQRHVINTMVVTNTAKEKGFYTVEYNNESYEYWYE